MYITVPRFTKHSGNFLLPHLKMLCLECQLEGEMTTTPWSPKGTGHPTLCMSAENRGVGPRKGPTIHSACWPQRTDSCWRPCVDLEHNGLLHCQMEEFWNHQDPQKYSINQPSIVARWKPLLSKRHMVSTKGFKDSLDWWDKNLTAH